MLVFASLCCIIFWFDRIGPPIYIQQVKPSSTRTMYATAERLLQGVFNASKNVEIYYLFAELWAKHSGVHLVSSLNSNPTTCSNCVKGHFNVYYHPQCSRIAAFFGRIRSRFRCPQKHGNQPPRCRVMRNPYVSVRLPQVSSLNPKSWSLFTL